MLVGYSIGLQYDVHQYGFSVGLPYKATQIRGIKGFNATLYDNVKGEMEVELSFGPSGAKKVTFYVVPSCPSPLIGYPTICDFKLIINTTDHNMVEEDSGLIVSCSSTECWHGGTGKEPEKKPKKPSNAKKEKGESSDSKSNQKN